MKDGAKEKTSGGGGDGQWEEERAEEKGRLCQNLISKSCWMRAEEEGWSELAERLGDSESHHNMG